MVPHAHQPFIQTYPGVLMPQSIYLLPSDLAGTAAPALFRFISRTS
jgi:hypothetical protein